ncbi:amino acid adenylation domain-containing protein [Micromonospora sp. NBC_01740]|uniref:non-ribosomal peptide synthetase n=1 Tax=Micromonospora sp. NBC_01740 TaxID=2975986 RepID=UPI002E1270D1|nr:non-ribosomal peptide synthetase [Micromonospora sp. NBC_01740]WSG01203.1 amino acid adenylation domain-containing protein [Micromonospora sp. NBC_01740]
MVQDPGLAHAVLAQASRTPEAVAVADGDRRLSYADLDAASAAVARSLRRAGTRPGQAVAVHLPRGWRLVCVMLGILRLGATVVPLDRQSPPARRDHMLRDSGAVAVVHGPEAPGDLPDGVRPLPAEALLAVDAPPAGDAEPEAAPAPVAFVFYTSGTTGRPKGVEVRDAGVLRLARPGYVALTPAARYASLANPAFDAISFEVWVPLLTGGCCVVLDDETVATPHLLDAALRRERIDTLFITVALFNAVVDERPHCFADAGQVLVGGEQLNARLIRRWYRDNPASRTRLHNVYGPTEATTFALCHPIPRDFDAEVVPIGRVLPGTDAHLVVDGERVAAPGEVAELYLGGAALAAGYRNLPEETTARFVRLPWLDGSAGRHYRTGDLVRADAAGRVEYVGRVDRQVKVRGFRVEPGEVERQVLAHPGVRQAYVCTRRDPVHGTNELLAYLVTAGDLSYAEFDRHLTATLPPYLRPHRVHRVGALPLTANGKVDADALLRRDDPPWRAGRDDPPGCGGRDDPPRRGGRDDPHPHDGREERHDPHPHDGRDGEPAEVAGTAWQRAVLGLAGEVLGVPDLRPDDRWIASGGDSLKALRLRFEIQRRWGAEVPQAVVLGGDLAELATAVATARTATGSPYPVPAPPSGARSAPATSEQQRLWLLQQRSPASTAYHVGLAFELRGRVDVDALRHALRRVVARHPALRTAFRATPEGLRQEVGDPYDPWREPTPTPASASDADGAGAGARADDWAGAGDRAGDGDWAGAGDGAGGGVGDGDWAGWRERARALFAASFDLGQPRMLRAYWLARDGGGVLLLHLHHIAVDGWSLDVLFRGLSAAYAAALAGTTEDEDEPAPTPLDYARWQAEWFARPAYRAQRDALRGHYADVTEVAAPLRPIRKHGGTGDHLLHTTIGPERRAALDRLGAELGLTRFPLLLTLFGWAVHGVTGRTHPRVASPVANRPVRDFEASVGMFANTVLLPLALAPAEELRAQLRRQADAVRAVLDAQDVALAHAVADHDFGADAPLFDFLFVLDNTDFSALALPGCASRPVWLAPTEAKCPLTLSVVAHESGFDCLWEYADEHFDAADVAAAAELFRRGLDALTGTDPSTLAELVRPYRRGLPEPGRGSRTPSAFPTVAEAFARRVRAEPTATALVAGDRRLSYADLDAYASALAAELLRDHPVSTDDRHCVALFFEPSVEHVVALLSAARLNLTVVPLDRAYPPALLRQVLGQVDPLCVLLAPGDEPALDVIDEGAHPRHPVVLSRSATPVAPSYAGRPLYTLFTSGSTGTPKGVQVGDALLVNLLRWQSEAGGLAGAAATLQFSMLSFDVSFQEIFGTLCGGGTLHLPRPGLRQDMPALLAHLDAAGIERIFLPYVALQLLAEHGVRLGRYPSRLREVVTAGEQLICTDSIRRWFAGLPGARLFNHYGPTETHVVSSLCLDGDPATWPTRPAIGRPVANTWLRVVDSADEVVPPDCPGQLLIGGELVAPCYLDDPALDRARFVELPGDGWFFRSGDQARFDRDGLLHYLGRDDQQVKVSGHRLELGQVEAALLAHPAVVNAVVVRDDPHLVACLELRADPPSPEELTGHLAGLLPGYVRVDRFRRLPELPRTASGKLDRRRALTAPGEELRPGAAAPAPVMSVLESRLAKLFEEVVGTPIAPDRRFFDQGAGSLDLMRFHLRCAAEGLPLSIPDLFEHVTIRRLARFLTEQRATEAAVGARDGAVAGPADEPVAVVGMAVRLPGAADLAAFWAMVEAGDRGIEHFDAADGLVGARSQLAGVLGFDPGHFGISRQEARLMDPQQRHLLMSCVEALAHAGIADPAGQRVGLLASCGENTYFQTMLREADPARLPDSFQLALHHEKDFLATKVAYHLRLTGPAFTVQAACASSLVAVHVAAGLLRQGDSDVMLVGGVLVDPLLTAGYRYQPQHIFSPDGHCRPFSDDAGGTVGASGVGVVVLKPLRLARRDGDTVYAVITGSAVNNDGAEKIGYAAPSVAGQREVIRTALRRSGRTSGDVGYVEAHGTGTELGDPVEVAALRQAFDLAGSGRVALASVKSQIGHLGAAAGVVGLVRAVLAVHHGLIPPNVDFRRLNPRLGPDPAPFHVPTKARPWPVDRPRVAAVSSFGIGGTNAHLVCEAVAQVGAGPETPPVPGVPVVLLASGSAAGLRADADRIADYLAARPEAYHRVLRHLQAGRTPGRWRAAAVCADAAAAVAWLRTATAVEVTPVEAAPVAVTGPAGTPPAADLVAAWLAGRPVRWPAGPAQPPWDFPPPAFVLVDHEFARAAPPAGSAPPAGMAPPAGAASAGVASPGAASPGVPAAAGAAPADQPWPARLSEAEWLHQPHWVRWRHAGADPGARRPETLVVMAAEPPPPAALRAFAASHARVVAVTAADGFARLGPDSYQADPADPESLGRLLDALTGADAGSPAAPGHGGVDWLHALPLAVDGPVGADALAHAYRACVDTPAALLAAVAALPRRPRLRAWWLSQQAQPVHDDVRRPELGLLAGVCEVAPQEGDVASHWVDLPGPDPADWAPALAALLAEETPPRRLALRGSYWWEQALLPVRPPAAPATHPLPAVPATRALPAGPAVYVVLGGTGGIGRSIAAWLLEQGDCRVVLLARRGPLPAGLARWADRVDLVEGDLAEAGPDELLARLDARTRRVDGVVHAAGIAAGGLIGRRDAAAMRRATAGRAYGALLVERLVARHRPSFVVYCSSMSAQLGGVGQLDYAATNGLLDGFARHRADGADTTLRISVGWDVWSEVGLARDALPTDARHRAHLAVGLSVDEGRRLFAQALRLRLPQLLVCTTALDRAREFYAPLAGPADATPAVLPRSAAEQVGEWLCDWLGVDALDPAASLYDLGADSLLLLDLIDRVKERFGVSLGLSQLSHRVSLAEVLGLLGEPVRAADPADPAVAVEVWQAGRGRAVLCLVHPVGGDVQAYRPLVSALDPELTVCVIADPALVSPGQPAWSLAERAARYHAALRDRFPRDEWRWRLAGWSFGAWVALGMAAEAEAAGQPADELYLLDPPPPDAAPAFEAYDEERLAALFAHELGAATGANTAATAYANALARCCRANLASMAQHTLPRLAGTPGRLWLAGRPTAGLPALGAPQEQARTWRGHLTGLAWHLVDTTHYGIVEAPHVDMVAGAINEAELATDPRAAR